MKRFSKGIGVMMAVISAACIFSSGSALAANNDFSEQIAEAMEASGMATSATPAVSHTDDVGNTFSAGQDVPVTGEIINEAAAAGYTVELTEANVTNNAYLAGYTVDVSDSVIGGSVCMAGYSLKMNSEVANNIFAAGNILTFNPGSAGKSLYAAGNILDISGTYDIVDVSGATITFDGTATGNVDIEADKVVIGDNANIGGTLTVTSAAEPVIPDGANIGEYKFIKAVTPDYEDAIDVHEKPTVGSKILKVVKSIIYWIIASAILAFILCAIFGKSLDDASEMVTKKPVAMLLSGFIALIALPVALILACVTYVGLPLAGFTTLVAMPIMFFSTIFASASFGRLLFNKIKPGFNPVAASLLGAIIVVVIKKVPIVGGLVGFTCMLYTIGYFIQVAFRQMKTFHLKREVIADVQDHVM